MDIFYRRCQLCSLGFIVTVLFSSVTNAELGAPSPMMSSTEVQVTNLENVWLQDVPHPAPLPGYRFAGIRNAGTSRFFRYEEQGGYDWYEIPVPEAIDCPEP